MIIPIRCFSCGKPISTYYQAYKKLVSELNDDNNESEITRLTAHDVNNGKITKSSHGKIMDTIGITRICCRRHMLGTEDTIDII